MESAGDGIRAIRPGGPAQFFFRNERFTPHSAHAERVLRPSECTAEIETTYADDMS